MFITYICIYKYIYIYNIYIYNIYIYIHIFIYKLSDGEWIELMKIHRILPTSFSQEADLRRIFVFVKN